MKWLYLVGGFLIMSFLVSADSDWTRPPATETELLWQENGNDIYYSAGDVGIGDSTPDGVLDIQSSSTHTKLVMDNTAGIYDSVIEFRNAGTLEWQICGYDDSSSDELEFIRGGSSCSSQDIMTLTSEGLEMGNGRLYFDRSNAWVGSSPSARYNNQFTVRNSFTTNISSISYYVDGQPLWIVCNDAVTVFKDSYLGGNLQLSGDFHCGVGDTLHLIFNDVFRDWVEISRSNN